jgi:hypothetical protein
MSTNAGSRAPIMRSMEVIEQGVVCCVALGRDWPAASIPALPKFERSGEIKMSLAFAWV